MVTGEHGLLGHLVQNPAEGEVKREQDGATILLQPMVDKSVQVQAALQEGVIHKNAARQEQVSHPSW